MTNTIVIAALYQFKELPNHRGFKIPLTDLCTRENIRGTLLLAPEGINGTVAGTREAIERLKEHLFQEGLDNLTYKESFSSKIPFTRLKVRLKKEIVTLGLPHISPLKKVGTYVEPQAWNSLLKDPDVIVIDTRNTYEVAIGTFKGAMDPGTRHFSEFPRFVREKLKNLKHKKIAMACTGGIRCEKASSFMLEEGFKEVYHLKGGILKYLECTPPAESLWEGECFVFDQRVAVKEKVEEGHHSMCFGCRSPITEEDKLSALYEEGVTCPHCFEKKSEKSKARARTRHQQHLQRRRLNADIYTAAM